MEEVQELEAQNIEIGELSSNSGRGRYRHFRTDTIRKSMSPSLFSPFYALNNEADRTA